jgi:hypothetical protein
MSFYVAHRKGFVWFYISAIEADFLLISSLTTLTSFYVLDDQLLGSVRFTRRLVTLVDF